MSDTIKSFLEIFFESVFAFKRWFWKLTAASLLFHLPVVIADRLFWDNTEINEWVIKNTSLKIFRLIDNTILFLFFLLLLLTISIILQIIHLYAEGRPASIRKQIKISFENLPHFFFINILYLLKVALWSLCLIIPGFVMGVHYSFAPLIYLTDQRKMDEAFKESKVIIKGKFIKYLDYLLFVFMAIFCVGIPLYQLLIALHLYVYSHLGYFGLARLVGYVNYLLIFNLLTFWLVFYYHLYRAFRVNRIAKN